jgi:hypothetical protein
MAELAAVMAITKRRYLQQIFRLLKASGDQVRLVVCRQELVISCQTEYRPATARALAGIL